MLHTSAPRPLGGTQPQREVCRNSLGSGFIIDQGGYIVTNNHVIENAADIKVSLVDTEEFDAKVVGRDPQTEVALIKIEAHRDLPVAPLGDSDKLRVGEWVVAIGNPFGLGQTVTAGIASAKGRLIGAGAYDDFIQTDTSINSGNSGGPLFNLHGEVVGINTAIVAAGQGIGFAIPINLAQEVLTQLRQKGRVTRGFLGVQVQQGHARVGAIVRPGPAAGGPCGVRGAEQPERAGGYPEGRRHRGVQRTPNHQHA